MFASHPAALLGARRLAALMAAALLLGALTALPSAATTDDPCQHAPPGAFRDVASSNVHAANIDCIAAYDVVLGVGGGNYGPAGLVTRGQMASFLVNLAEVARDEVYATPVAAAFTDIAGTTHATNIAIAAQLGITRGATPTTYAPRGHVTRAQMASFVAQMVAAAGGTLPAGQTGAFGDTAGSVHAANIEALAAAGIVSGVRTGVYDPNGHVTRGQMATFLANTIRVLDAQGKWNGAIELADGDDATPDLTVVRRVPGGGDDQLELVWDRDVAVVGAASGIRVLGGDGATLVATGLQVSVDDERTMRLRVDAQLAGATYWLAVPAGLVTAGDVANEAVSVAFVLGAVDGGAAVPPTIDDVRVDGTVIADGGSRTIQNATPTISGSVSATGSTIASVHYRIGSGSWVETTAVDGAFDGASEQFSATLAQLTAASHTITVRTRDAAGELSALVTFTLTLAPAVPEIVTVAVDAANDRLVVTFDMAVECPNTASSRSAWHFENQNGGGDPSFYRGRPDAVEVTGDSTTCALVYSSTGIVAGDNGLLEYTQPLSSTARVRAVGGADLPSSAGIPVS